MFVIKWVNSKKVPLFLKFFGSLMVEEWSSHKVKCGKGKEELYHLSFIINSSTIWSLLSNNKLINHLIKLTSKSKKEKPNSTLEIFLLKSYRMWSQNLFLVQTCNNIKSKANHTVNTLFNFCRQSVGFFLHGNTHCLVWNVITLN